MRPCVFNVSLTNGEGFNPDAAKAKPVENFDGFWNSKDDPAAVGCWEICGEKCWYRGTSVINADRDECVRKIALGIRVRSQWLPGLEGTCWNDDRPPQSTYYQIRGGKVYCVSPTQAYEAYITFANARENIIMGRWHRYAPPVVAEPAKPSPRRCPMPGCSGRAEITTSGTCWVSCDNAGCWLCGPNKPTEAEAIAAWNFIANAIEAAKAKTENRP